METVKLNRTIGRWQSLDPAVMFDTGSKAALFYALKDAREDILALSKLLMFAAYPRRGTDEEIMDIQQFAERVQAVMPIASLEE